MNDIALSHDLTVIEQEIYSYHELGSRSVWEIGKRLNHVKENDLVHGQFGAWLKKIGMAHDTANRYMKINKKIKYDSSRNLGFQNLYHIALLPEEEKVEELKKADEGNPSTVRELKELNKKIKQKDEEIERLKNKPAEVIEKEVVKEVKITPHDYDGLKSDNNQLSQALKEEQQENQKMRAQLDQWRDEKGEIDKKSKRYDELSAAIKEMEGKMDAKQKRMAVVKDVTEKLKIGNELIDELSGLIYLTDYEELSRNEFLSAEINKLMYRLNNFIDDFSERLDKTTILEGEIIND